MDVQVTSKQLTEIVDAINDSLTWDEVQVHPTYSGRGMYGKNCIGFSGPGSIAFHVGLAFGRVMDEDEVRDLSPAQDNMGLGTIVYFSNLQLAEGETWDKDSDE